MIVDFAKFKLWNPVVRMMVRMRLLHCYMCDNKGADGCSCGACGLVEVGSAGYPWCASFVGCEHCGRDTR